MVIRRVRISGKVQGVFFRAFTQEEAQRLGLRGWVRNLPDRSVEALLLGEQGAVDRMIAWLHTGSPISEVREVMVHELEESEEFDDFTIRY